MSEESLLGVLWKYRFGFNETARISGTSPRKKCTQAGQRSNKIGNRTRWKGDFLKFPQVTNTTFKTVQSTHQEQCEMLKVFYLSCLMTSHSGLLWFDSESQNGELSYISTFKGGPSRYMIGNFRHNLHIINSRIDIVEAVRILYATLLDQG